MIYQRDIRGGSDVYLRHSSGISQATQTYLRTYLPTQLPIDLATQVHIYLTTYLHTYVHTYLRTCVCVTLRRPVTSTRILILVSKYLFVLQCYAIFLSKKKAKLKAGIEIPVLYSPKNIRMPPGLSISTLRLLNRRGGIFFLAQKCVSVINPYGLTI